MEIGHSLLPEEVLTVDQATALGERLAAAADMLYRNETTPPATVLQKNLLDEEYNYFVQYSEKNKLKLADRPTLQELLEKAREKLIKMPLIVIRIAFQPSHEFTGKLLNWFKKNGPGQGRIKIVYDKNCIGGLILEYDGRLYDHSLAKVKLPYERISDLSRAV